MIQRIVCIKQQTKYTLLTSLLGGVICHLYVMVGHYPAYSGLNLFINNCSVQITEGRWLASILMSLDGNVTLPWVIGLISIIGYAFSNTILIDILQVKKTSSNICICLLMISFPVLASKYYYLYMADVYAASLLFALLGVWFWNTLTKENYIKNASMTVMFFFFSLSCYQADMSYALVLMIGIILYKLWNSSKKEFSLYLLSFLIIMTVSFFVYGAFFKLYQYIIGINSYRNIVVNVDSLIQGVKSSYCAFIWFYTQCFWSKPVGRVLLVATVTVIILCYSKIIIMGNYISRTMIVKSLLSVVMIMMLPIFLDYTYIVSPYEPYVCRLFGAHVFLVLLPIMLQERKYSNGDFIFSKKINNLVYVCSITMIWFFFVLDNTAYMNQHLQYEKDYSLAVRIVCQIESTEGYRPGMEVVIIQNDGYNVYENDYTKGILTDYLPGMDQRGNAIMSTSYGIKKFIEEFVYADININSNVACGEIDDSILTELEPFPSSNDIYIDDDKLYFLLTK
ncbi:MAG: glucosyltransferase domain-containing protein [Pseudobutyrivibrio sp.]|nr:glucosyltransferase domain-containing protein [Pseudobutyrivibrio sp.]